MLFHGDCLIELEKIEDCSIDLVYLDPPFFTQSLHTLKNKECTAQYSFNDTWDNLESYTHYIKKRLELCKAVLKDTGSIFLHCDHSASHYLRIVLDEVFGYENFQSEIIWCYKRWSNAKKGLLNSHQVIFFYSKTKDFKFNTIYTDYSPTTNLDQIFQKRIRGKNGKTVYKQEDGHVELLHEKKGVPLSNVWEIPYLNPKAKERVGYPTQKPILLLEKIIKITTDEEDIVLDPFCGSGTTLVASQLLKRKYIGMDISKEAIQLSETRLKNPIKTESHLLKNGKESYITQDKDILSILAKIDGIPVWRNKGIDGFLKIHNSFKPIPIKVQRKSETFEMAKHLLIQACQKNGYSRKVLITIGKEQSIFDTKISDKNLIIANGVDDFLQNKKELYDMFFN